MQPSNPCIDTDELKRICYSVFRDKYIRYAALQQAIVVAVYSSASTAEDNRAAAWVACKFVNQSRRTADRLRDVVCQNDLAKIEAMTAAELRLLQSIDWRIPKTPMRWADLMGGTGGGLHTNKFCLHTTSLLVGDPQLGKSCHELAVKTFGLLKIRCTQPGGPSPNLAGLARAIAAAAPVAGQSCAELERIRAARTKRATGSFDSPVL